MFDQFLLTVNQWMTGGSAAVAAVAFAWGLASVLFSPCHLASIPLVVAYVGGQHSVVQPRRAVWYAGAFSAGLFVTIAVLGAYFAAGPFFSGT